MDREYYEFIQMKHIEDDLEVLSLGYQCLAIGNEALECGNYSYARNCFESAHIYKQSYMHRANDELYRQLIFATQMCWLRYEFEYTKDYTEAARLLHAACHTLATIAKDIPPARVLAYKEQLETLRKEIESC